jgi:hypothetical protein
MLTVKEAHTAPKCSQILLISRFYGTNMQSWIILISYTMPLPAPHSQPTATPDSFTLILLHQPEPLAL